MTSKALKGDREKCLRAGMDDFVTKPVSPHSWSKRWKPGCRRGANVSRSGQSSVPHPASGIGKDMPAERMMDSAGLVSEVAETFLAKLKNMAGLAR